MRDRRLRFSVFPDNQNELEHDENVLGVLDGSSRGVEPIEVIDGER